MSNPFLNAEVNAPVNYREYFQRYSQTTGASTVSEYIRKPFPRMVDFWFAAICVAVSKELKPIKLDGIKTYKAIEGAAIASPEWRIHALQLIAIAQTMDVNIVKDGSRMMEIANGLAFAGMPILIEILEGSPGDEALVVYDEFVALTNASSHP